MAESRSAVAKQDNIHAYHEEKGWRAAFKIWSLVGLVQLFILSFFVFTGGSIQEFLLFWLLPAVTLTRTLMAVRLMGEHTSRGKDYADDVRYLVTLPCSRLERLLFAPLGFNYHAEHHLFPYIPWYHLQKLHKTLMKLAEYRRLADVRKGYIHAIFHNCVIGKK